MKVSIVAVGRLRPGAEADLISDYASRFNRTGRPLGLGPLTIHEVDAKKGGPAAEAALLDKATQGAAPLIALDERGDHLTSPQFARKLADWRDDGNSDACFVIGGADGLAPALRDAAHLRLGLGKMVWPHMLVRVMLAEQLYRAATILGGSPYHRN